MSSIFEDAQEDQRPRKDDFEDIDKIPKVRCIFNKAFFGSCLIEFNEG